MKTNLQLHYSREDERNWADVTHNGFYVCEIHQCSRETKRAFHCRCKRIKVALEKGGVKGTSP